MFLATLRRIISKHAALGAIIAFWQPHNAYAMDHEVDMQATYEIPESVAALLYQQAMALNQFIEHEEIKLKTAERILQESELASDKRELQRNKKRLQRQNRRSDPRLVECGICKNKYLGIKGLKRHQSRAKDCEPTAPVDDSDLIPCDICERKFRGIHGLHVHQARKKNCKNPE